MTLSINGLTVSKTQFNPKQLAIPADGLTLTEQEENRVRAIRLSIEKNGYAPAVVIGQLFDDNYHILFGMESALAMFRVKREKVLCPMYVFRSILSDEDAEKIRNSERLVVVSHSEEYI
jgi:hypothetical protein